MSPRRKVINTAPVEALRGRLAAVMAKTVTTSYPCSHCGGKGSVERTAPLSALDVQRATGVASAAVGLFMRGKSLSLENGLALMHWLDEQEKPARAKLLDSFPDDAPRSQAAREAETIRMRQLRNASAGSGCQGRHRRPGPPAGVQVMTRERRAWRARAQLAGVLVAPERVAMPEPLPGLVPMRLRRVA